jgi:hypothetical protein
LLEVLSLMLRLSLLLEVDMLLLEAVMLRLRLEVFQLLLEDSACGFRLTLLSWSFSPL